MENISKYIKTYKQQLKIGEIQKAYKGLMEFINQLKQHLQKTYPEYNIPSKMYYGFMDITYFAYCPTELKSEKLKLAILFNHLDFTFEIWLVGQNKTIQKKYWDIFHNSDWNTYPITPSPEHAIIQYTLKENPDFKNPLQLISDLEHEICEFTENIVKTFH